MSWHQKLYPLGHFTLFRLTPLPVAKVFVDLEGIAAAKAFEGKVYLGCVGGRGLRDLFHDAGNVLRLSLFIACTSSPKPSPPPHPNEHSFIPIAPATHPLGVKAVVPTSPFPWKNCLFPGEAEFNFIRGIDHGGTENLSQITIDDLDDVCTRIHEDVLERAKACPPDVWQNIMFANDKIFGEGATVNDRDLA